MTVASSGSHEKLHLRVNDVPSPISMVFFGLQQMLISLSSTLVLPYLISDISCAGQETIALRVKLIAATLVTGGIATIAQTTFGIRLSILHGPSFAFLPPLFAYALLPENVCKATVNDFVPEEEWKTRFLTIQGSLLSAVAIMLILGLTGLVGLFAKCVGPITVCPLMILLTLGTVPTAAEKMGLHWISVVEYVILIILVIFLENVEVPVPMFNFKTKSFKFVKARVFGQFPYLIGVLTAWFICYILTVTDIEPPEGPARTDKNQTIAILHESPWFQVPYPFQFGSPKFDVGLFLGFVASTFACLMESIGDYKICAKVSHQRPPPTASINRAIIFEGFGSVLAAMMGVGSGVTTYAENIALMHITKVVSRSTMQMAGVMLIVLGLFTKVAAVMASIPDAVIGGVLAMGLSMITGVALSNLTTVDLRISRNITIIGAAIMVGSILPEYISKNYIHTGVTVLDSSLNMLLSIRMLIGGLMAFVLDNVVSGATYQERGFAEDSKDDEKYTLEDDGYALPTFINNFLDKYPIFSNLPFLPSKRSIQRIVTLQSMPK